MYGWYQVKPQQKSRVALHMLHFFTKGLACADDVVEAARGLSVEELAHFKRVAGLAFRGTVLERVLPVIERL